MKQHKRWTRLAAATVLVGLLAACGDDKKDTADTKAPAASTASPSASTGTPPAEMLSTSIAVDGFTLGTLPWVADAKGYFAEAGIKAKMQQYGTGIEAVQAVVARQADMGPALDFAMLNLAGTAKDNMNVIAALAQPKPGFHKLIASGEISGPADLKGKKIGYVEGTSEHYVTQKYLVDAGVQLSDVTLVPLPGLFELVGALKSGDIQASWLWANGVAEALKDAKLKQITDDSSVLGTVSVFLIAGRDWTEKHPEEVARVLTAFNQASTFVNANNDEAAKIIADAVHGDAAQIAQTNPNQNWKLGFAQEQLDALDQIAQFLIGSGKLAKDFDVRSFLNFEIMEKVLPGSVTAKLG